MKGYIERTEEYLLEEINKDYCNYHINYLLGSLYEKKNMYFDCIIHYKRALLQLQEGEEREKLQDLIDRIEYREYDEETIYKMRKYKNQVKEYAKYKLLNPDINIEPNHFITLENPIKTEKIKVLYGSLEIANTMNIYSNALRKLEYQSFCINFYPSYLNYKADYSFNIKGNDWESIKDQIIDLVAYLISEFNIFHFIFNTTLMPDHSDLFILKKLNKKMIMNNVGSDIRQYSKAIQMNKYWDLVKNTYFRRCSEDRNIKKIKFLSNFIDFCITIEGELMEYVKSYYKKCLTYRIPIDLGLYPVTEVKKKEKLLVVHAPTNPEVKGSKYIVETIEELKKKYNFDFVLLKYMPHIKAKELYKQADIIVDQIIIGEYGSLAIECMAMGKPVVCWICDFSKKKYPRDLPIVSANKDNLYEKMEELILNSDLRNELGIKGRRYVEKYHDVNILITELLGIYSLMNEYPINGL